MIKSMTGYGSAKGVVDGMEISIELKSVNNKFLDTSIRSPRSFLFAEELIKSRVQAHISRGKVDVFVNVSSSEGGDMTVKVNDALLRCYLDAIGHIAERYGLPNDATAMSVSRFPDVLTVEKREVDQSVLLEGIAQIAEAALADHDAMRLREGEKLKADILSHLAVIRSLVETVEAAAPETVVAYRKRLTQKMEEVLVGRGIDESRILMEAAIYADHIAVDEETVRLRSHIDQLTFMMNGGSPIGRKTDFLIQEFNREANTIGSKCQDAKIAYVVVELKAEIEKIREQIQNIE
ncbi:MAG: YicC family protein [Oscillospiraceae bacterium]|nr:YicC family protein [Oscillospiraceae bacterium]